MFTKICLVFLFLPLAKQDDIHDALAAVLHSVEGLINFYNDDYVNLNVDGLFGLRVLEGHTEAIIQKYGQGQLQHLGQGVIARLQVVRHTATTICSTAEKHVRGDDVNYYNTMSFVVGSPWEIFDETRRTVDTASGWTSQTYHKAKETVTLDEKQSDECMSELMGSHKVGGARCDISGSCARIMTTPGLVGYSITHQLLWTMLAEKAGCRQQLEEKLRSAQIGSLTYVRHDLCSNNYIQLNKSMMLAKPKLISPELQDLFLEQLFICPSLGYFEFLSLDYLPEILGWQFPVGCFGDDTDDNAGHHSNMDDSDARHAATEFNFRDFIGELNIGDDSLTSHSARLHQNKSQHNNHKRQIKPNKQSVELYNIGRKPKNPTANVDHSEPAVNGDKDIFDTHPNKGRKLLVEKEMTGGCLSHKTAVATGALILYLRYLSEPDADVIFSRTRTAGLAHSRFDIVPDNIASAALQETGGDADFRPGHKVVNVEKLLDTGANQKPDKLGVNKNNNTSAIGGMNKLGQNDKLLLDTERGLGKHIKDHEDHVNVELQTQQSRKLVNLATTAGLLAGNPAHVANGVRFIQPPLDTDKFGVIKPGINSHQSVMGWQQVGERTVGDGHQDRNNGNLRIGRSDNKNPISDHKNAASNQDEPALLTDYHQVPAPPDAAPHNQQNHGVPVGMDSRHANQGHGNQGVLRRVKKGNEYHQVAAAGHVGNGGLNQDTEIYEYKYDNDDGVDDDDDDDGADADGADDGGYGVNDEDGGNEDDYYVDAKDNPNRKLAHPQLKVPANGIHYNDNDIDKFNTEDDDDDDNGYDDDDYDNDEDNDTPKPAPVVIDNPKGHINARNLVREYKQRVANKDYKHNKMYASFDHKAGNGNQAYKYDDNKDDKDKDDDDEYTYDDDDQKHVEAHGELETPQGATSKLSKQLPSGFKTSSSLSSTTLYVFLVFVIVLILLVYRFLKKRKIRLRFHPSMLYRV